MYVLVESLYLLNGSKIKDLLFDHINLTHFMIIIQHYKLECIGEKAV